MQFVDSHCHLNLLDLAPYSGSLDLLLEATRRDGIAYILCIGVDSQTTPAVIAIANRYADVSATVGIHPTEQESKELSVVDIIKLAEPACVVAMGETGLDYYRLEDNSTVELQKERFRRHIRAARELKKPLIIHTRQAQEDTLKILREEHASDVGGVLHCFTESLAMAQQAMELNFYISFSGIITFHNAQALREVVKEIPLARMLIETDAPYLAPVPHRGKPNQPAYVRHVAEMVANLKQETIENVAKQTTHNFFNLFNQITHT